ncbi:MAG TPA: 2OG-Fe(II) oxygenase [Caulobacteraceae bacterium]|nr:2OG-Fe(II) oxygenase [Caulobacteraceae bacterium]
MSDFPQLRTAADGGDLTAQFELAKALDGAGRHSEALDWLARASDAGSADAALLLGVRLFTGQAAPKSLKDGVAKIARAADLGSAEACGYLAAFAAEGMALPQDWNAALDWLATGAGRGNEACRAQLRLLAPEAVSDDWPKARASIDLDAWLATPAAKILSQSPRVVTVEAFLAPQICAWMIESARDKLTVAPIYDDQTGGALKSERRSNTNAVFHPIEGDVIHALVRARMGRVADVSPLVMEPLAVLHYDVGQEFRRHVDFINPGVPSFALEIAEKGQRIATFLTYLNEDFEGAETEFPVLALRWRGKTGDAILFRNVDPSGAPDRRTLHAGRTPTRGEKWLLSQFIRDKTQTY